MENSGKFESNLNEFKVKNVDFPNKKKNAILIRRLTKGDELNSG